MNVSEKIEQAYKTWNRNGGFHTNAELMGKNIINSIKNKKILQNKFLQNQEKIIIPINLNGEFNYLDRYNAIREYGLQNRYSGGSQGVMWKKLTSAPNYVLQRIANNLPMNDYNTRDFLAMILNRVLIYHDIEDIEVDADKFSVYFNKALNLNEQILDIVNYYHFPDYAIEEIMSVFQTVQNLQFPKNSKMNFVISTDPIDFIACNINDYYIHYANNPSGAKGETSLTLMNDGYTAVAYIETLEFQTTLYNDEMINAKNLTTFIHFNDNYSGAIILEATQEKNQKFNQLIIDFLKQNGLNTELEYDIEEIIKNTRIRTPFIGDNLYPSNFFFVGNPRYNILIGNEYYCLDCGALIYNNLHNDGICIKCFYEGITY
jgi:hypothetical protein